MGKLIHELSVSLDGYMETADHGLDRTIVDDELARIREEFDGDLDVGGATLAAAFIRRGLVDGYRLVVHPVAIGGGTPFFPPLDTPLRLRQVASHRFTSGVVYLGHVAA